MQTSDFLEFSDAELARLTPRELEAYLASLERKHNAARINKYVPSVPHAKQRAFLAYKGKEALYGGSAGGGKSEALLMDALRYVEEPSYSALILRRTYKDLAKPGALMDRSMQWLKPTDATWHGRDFTWKFPSGASLTFGYVQRDPDVYQFQSAEFQYIAWDELTQFNQWPYRYMFSRLRRVREADHIPLRVRSGSNPGGIGHEWVRERFIQDAIAYSDGSLRRFDDEDGERAFFPAKMDDNPSLDREEYEKALAKLDPVTREQLRNGDWNVRSAGGYFRREWFPMEDTLPSGARWLRVWDLAATPDGDWTCGIRIGRTRDGLYYVSDVVRFKGTPQQVEKRVFEVAEMDGKAVEIYMEQEPGSSGVNVIDHYRRVLDGFIFRGVRATGNKEDRAKPASAAAEARKIRIAIAPWNSAFFDEVEAFPEAPHDDQVDCLASGVNILSHHWIPLAAPSFIARQSYWRQS